MIDSTTLTRFNLRTKILVWPSGACDSNVWADIHIYRSIIKRAVVNSNTTRRNKLEKYRPSITNNSM